MANCPVQIILNSDKYITDMVVNPGGSNRDLFSGRNEEFLSHKDRVIDMFSGISKAQTCNNYSSIGIAKVKLVKNGWAKSNRPINAVFSSRNGCKVIGGLHAGEMLVKMSPDSKASGRVHIE